MFDCHIHSNFSGDSEMPAEAACKSAINAGLKGIAFTDHLDIDYPAVDTEYFQIDFDKYSIYMDDLKNKFKGDLKVLKGIEIGIQPHVVEESLKISRGYDFDFIIGSIHIIDKLDPYTGGYFEGKSKQQAYYRYLTEVDSGIDLFHDFDVIGHIGYIRRYGNYDDRTLRYNDYNDIVDSILRKVVSLGKGIEVNTSGYRNGLGSPIPDYDILKRYREFGGEILTVGSDAHYPEHIAHSFDIVRQMLLNIGFKYTTHFENRKPIFDKI